MKRNAMKSNSISAISLRLDFFEGQSNMFSVAAGGFLVLNASGLEPQGQDEVRSLASCSHLGRSLVHHGFFLEFLVQTFLDSYWGEKRNKRLFVNILTACESSPF